MNEDFKMKYIVGELQGLRKVFEYLCDGNPKAFSALYFIKSNYKQWTEMVRWLANNKIYGDKLVDLFQNESPDGDGYHLGATYILSRLKGKKFTIDNVKVNELL